MDGGWWWGVVDHSLLHYVLPGAITASLHAMYDAVHVLREQLVHAADDRRGRGGLSLLALGQPRVLLHLLQAGPPLGVHHQHHADETGEEKVQL